MDHLSNVQAIVEEKADELDAFIVDMSLNGNQFVAHVDTIQGISIQDCRVINRAIDNYLIENELDWSVEVGSPGLTQGFRVPQQYEKNVGRKISVLASDGKKYEGELKSADENQIVIEWEEKVRLEGRKKKVKETFSETFYFFPEGDNKGIKEAKVIISFN